MRRWLVAGLLLSTIIVRAQNVRAQSVLTQNAPSDSPASQPPPPAHPAVPSEPVSIDLPDSPGHVVSQQSNVIAVAEAYQSSAGITPPCRVSTWKIALNTRATIIHPNPDDPNAPIVAPHLCPNRLDPHARFLNTTMPIPMSPAEKGMLAIRDVLDPFNLVTILGSSAVTIGANSRSAYGPGLKGFGKLTGVSYLQDATGEFFGTFAIPSIVHEDPHYHRLPSATIPRRILHAVSRTVIAQHDDGSPMPNYATLLTYPITAEIDNLYVPGIQSDSRSTALRIVTGYAFDPVNNIVTEFLPDVARRIHIRIIFVQQILNQVALGPPSAQ